MAEQKPWWSAYGEGETFRDTGTGTDYVIQGGHPVVSGSVQAEKNLAPISGADQQTLKDMQTASSEAQTLASATNDFTKRNSATPTGGLLGVLPFSKDLVKAVPAVAKLAGLKNTENLAPMDEDSIKAATALRSPGMRLTQMEFQKFLGGAPSIGTDRSGNRPFQAKNNAANTMAQAQTAFYQSYADTHRKLAGALPAWLKFQSDHFDSDGNYYHDPTTNPQRGQSATRPAVNSALQGQSTQARAMAPAAVQPPMYDIYGQPMRP
jgi:hypothetical protein